MTDNFDDATTQLRSGLWQTVNERHPGSMIHKHDFLPLVQRAVFVPFMMGQHFGVPFHRELQRRIILEAFDHLIAAEQSGDIGRLPIAWSQARREGKLIKRTLNSPA